MIPNLNEINEGLRLDAGVHNDIVLKNIEVISDEKGDKIAFDLENSSGTHRHMEFAPDPNGNNYPKKDPKTGNMESEKEAYERVAREVYTRILHMINRFIPEGFKLKNQSSWLAIFNEIKEAWETSELKDAKLRLVLVHRSVASKYPKVPKRPRFLQRMEDDGQELVMDKYWQDILSKRNNATPDADEGTEDYSEYL